MKTIMKIIITIIKQEEIINQIKKEEENKIIYLFMKNKMNLKIINTLIIIKHILMKTNREKLIINIISKTIMGQKCL
jgi:hypothetical protein